MPDYVLAARRAAKRYGIDPDKFVRQIRAESNFNRRARSPAGASGIAQFMPETAKRYGVNLNDDRAADDLDGAARHMRDALRANGGDWRRALSVYNSGRPDGYKHIAETRNYVEKILGGSDPKNRSSASQAAAAPPRLKTAALQDVPELLDTGEARQQMLQQYLLERGRPGSLLGLASGLGDIESQAAQARTARNAALAANDEARADASRTNTERLRSVSGGTAGARGTLRPGGGYKGSQGLARSLANIGFELGLDATSEKRNNTNPYSGKGSDHDVGNDDAYAYDISDGDRPTPAMDRAAYRIMRQLGFEDYKMGQPIDARSGVKTIKTAKGTFRVQVIYRGTGAAFGGNHLNHIHVGVKRIG